MFLQQVREYLSVLQRDFQTLTVQMGLIEGAAVTFQFNSSEIDVDLI